MKQIKLNKWKLKLKLHEIIFEADTKSGKAFDILVLFSIVLSFITVLLESIQGIKKLYETELHIIEWIITIFFTLEYIARIIAVRQPLKYVFSFFGLIDLLAMLPTYLSLLLAGSQYMIVVRLIRLLRIFRIFKLVIYLKEAEILFIAIRASQYKIIVFMLAVLTFSAINGTIMYVIEGEENGFTSIPVSMYWAIVTLTTVGYGDLSPKSPIGQFIASIIMIMGYGIIAVPTGIVSVELSKAHTAFSNSQACPSCSKEGHDADSKYCKFCGEELNPKI
ncbi:MAG: ion transporter [Leptospiraceae bacterium]|nr:ion transporter [Leptospiraceae bacterium]